jgi:hypothetical protein
MLCVTLLCFIMPNVVMLSVIMATVVILNVTMLSVVMLSVTMPNVVMLSVATAFKKARVRYKFPRESKTFPHSFLKCKMEYERANYFALFHARDNPIKLFFVILPPE